MIREIKSIERVKHPASKVDVFRYGFECGHFFVGDLRSWGLDNSKPRLWHPVARTCGDCK